MVLPGAVHNKLRVPLFRFQPLKQVQVGERLLPPAVDKRIVPVWQQKLQLHLRERRAFRQVQFPAVEELRRAVPALH